MVALEGFLLIFKRSDLGDAAGAARGAAGPGIYFPLAAGASGAASGHLAC